jgi:aldose 1-epimerase
MEARISDYGGVLVSLLVPDRDRALRDVVMGFDSAAGYEQSKTYCGALVGRSANRIRGSRFMLDGREYRLACNEGANSLHSGPDGYERRLWNVKQTADNSLKLTLFSPDGDQGYPGNLIVSVTYIVSADNALGIVYGGMADSATPFNLTNHAYFKLGGQDSETVLNDELMIRADAVTAVDETLCPTGEIMNVTGTPFDFRKSKKIGRDIGADHPQLRFGGGYDHNFVLRHEAGEPDVEACCEASGICMRLYTDLPGVQLYTGNGLGESEVTKEGRRERQHGAMCLETQFYPDAVNHPEFPSPVIGAGKYTEHFARFAFSTM